MIPNRWKFELLRKTKPKLNNPILIEGLPGIGNVGKVAADFIIDEINAKPLFNVFSHDIPNSVFVNEQNLVELPTIEIYFKKFNDPKKQDILILTGDVQPTEERSSYTFSESILNISHEYHVTEIITLGGIGLAEVPKKPQIFCTGNSKEIIKKYKKISSVNEKLYGIVGPIIGVTGLLVGLAEKQNIPAICLLAETLGHPAYLGIKGARELVKVLDKRLKLKIKISELDKEIEELEAELINKTQELGKLSKKSAMKHYQRHMKEETSYIG